jgi:sugar (pentulose or hexulose) kinase
MVSGNITRSAGSTQMLADILRRPVGVITQRSPAAYGAALLALRVGRRVAGGNTVESARTSQGSIEFKIPTAAPATYDALYRDYCEVASRCA